MTKFNPYEPPAQQQAHYQYQQYAGYYGGEQLAGRGARFGAAFIDGIANMVPALPVQYALGMFDGFPNIQLTFAHTVMYGGVGFMLWFAVQFYFLRNGQTLGKRMVGIRMVNHHDGQVTPMGSLVLTRYLPVSLAALIPVVGGLMSLCDVLFIFGQERRCLHDMIAGTKVVNA